MAYVDVKHKKIIDVPNKVMGSVTCSSLAAMCIVTDDVYCIKTDTASADKHAAYLVKISSFLESTRAFAYNPIDHNGTRKMFTHANGLAYHKKSGDAKGTFYIATGNPLGNGSQIIGVNSSGTVTMQITASDKISSIAYCGNEKYIVGCSGTNSNGHRLYKIVSFVHTSGTKYSVNELNDFYINVDIDYPIGHDIHYDISSHTMYVPMMKDGGKNNIILSYSVTENTSTEEGNALNPGRTLRDSNTEKFEIESLSMYNNKKYVCTNRESNGDGIYVLYV